MLLQSHTGVIRIFPALPESWEQASFHGLRARGAFIIDADYDGGRVQKVVIRSEKGGPLKVLNPFTGQVEERSTQPGDIIELNG